MGMVDEEDQSFEGLIDHLCETFQSVETLCKLISDFYCLKRPERLRIPLLMTCRCWPGRLLHGNLLSGKRPLNN